MENLSIAKVRNIRPVFLNNEKNKISKFSYGKKTIIGWKDLIDEIFYKMESTRYEIFRKTGKYPKTIIASKLVYEQIMCHHFNSGSPIYSNTIKEMNLIMDPFLEGYQFKLVFDYADEYNFEEELSRIERVVKIREE